MHGVHTAMCKKKGNIVIYGEFTEIKGIFIVEVFTRKNKGGVFLKI